MVDVWNINNTIYDTNIAINILNYARNFLLTLAEIDFTINQLLKWFKRSII